MHVLRICVYGSLFFDLILKYIFFSASEKYSLFGSMVFTEAEVRHKTDITSE